MVAIMRLRRRKRTVGVNQVFMDAQMESNDTASSNMAAATERDWGRI